MTSSPHPPQPSSSSSPLTLTPSSSSSPLPSFRCSSVVPTTTTTTSSSSSSKLSLRNRRREKRRLRNVGVGSSSGGTILRSSDSSYIGSRRASSSAHSSSSSSSSNGRTSGCSKSNLRWNNTHRIRAPPIPSFSPVLNDDDGDGDGGSGNHHGGTLKEGNEAGHITETTTTTMAVVVVDSKTVDGGGKGGSVLGNVVEIGDGSSRSRTMQHERATTTMGCYGVVSHSRKGGDDDRGVGVVGSGVDGVKERLLEKKKGGGGGGEGGDVFSLPSSKPKPVHDDDRVINCVDGGGDSDSGGGNDDDCAVVDGSNLNHGKNTILPDGTEGTNDISSSSLGSIHDGCSTKELRTKNSHLLRNGSSSHPETTKPLETIGGGTTGNSDTEKNGENQNVTHSRDRGRGRGSGGDSDGDDFDDSVMMMMMDAEGKKRDLRHTKTVEEKVEKNDEEDEIPSPSAFAKNRKPTRSTIPPPSGTDAVDRSQKESMTRRTDTRDVDTEKSKGVNVLGSRKTNKESCRVDDGSDNKEKDEDGEPKTNKKVGRNEKAQLGDRTGGRLRLTRVTTTKRKRHETVSKTLEQPSINVATNTTGTKTIGCSAVSKTSSVQPSGTRIVNLVSSPPTNTARNNPPANTNPDASSPPLSTEFDVTRAKALFDREKELGRKHSYLLQQSKAGEALADEARRRKRRTTTANLNGVATAYPTIDSSFGATNTTNNINNNRSSSINNNTKTATTPLTSLQTMAHREQQDGNNKDNNNPVSLARTDAEIERALLHRLARLEKSTAWFEHLRDKTGRELKRHRSGILKRRAKERERASLDGTAVEIWVEDEGGGRWRTNKRPRFLQDVEECGNEEGEDCVPPLPRSLVNRAKIRTFAFRKKRQPTLTQMVNSDETSSEGSDVEVVGNESEPEGGESRVARIDDNDGNDDDDNGEPNPSASGNVVHQAFEAEAAAKSSDDGDRTETKGNGDSTIDQNHVVGTEPSEIAVEATDRNVKDYGENCMLDLEKAISRGAKAAFWWDASSKREIPPHDNDPFDLFGLQEFNDSGAGTKVEVAKVNNSITMEDKKNEDEESCLVPNDEEGDCGLDDLLNLLESTKNDREICTVIERPLTANKTSIPDNNDDYNKRHPPISPTSNLTPNLLSISQRIVSDVLQNPSLLSAVRTARLHGGENDVDDWKDDVRYALSTTHNVANIEEALKNIRSRRRTMSCIGERVERALKNRGMVLDLYVRVLEEALEERMKKEELTGGKNGGNDGVMATVGVEDGGVSLGTSSICGLGAVKKETKRS